MGAGGISVLVTLRNPIVLILMQEWTIIMSLNLMFNIFNNVAPSYMCDINRISHRHNTRQSDSAYVVPGVKGQGSKSFKFNGSKLWNELPTNVKHVQQKIRFKKECKALLMTRMKEKEEMNVVP